MRPAISDKVSACPFSISLQSVHLLLILFLGALVMPSAHAQGSWQVQLHLSGSRSGVSIDRAPPQVRSISSSDNPYYTQFKDGNAKLNVSARVRLVWTGVGQPTPAPRSVLVSSQATAGCDGPGDQTVNNGIDSQKVVWRSNQPPFPSSTSMKGAKIVPVMGGGGTTIDVGTFELKSEITGAGSVLVAFEVTPDDRSVSISRRGARGEWTDGSGAKHGDTIYAWYVIKPDPLLTTIEIPVWNWQHFDASRMGSWSVAEPMWQIWSWNPQHSLATIDWNMVSIPFGSLNDTIFGWRGTPTGAAIQTVRYTYTDAVNGASASDTYVLHLHDQVENLQDDKEGITDDYVAPQNDIISGPFPVADGAASEDREYNAPIRGSWTLEMGWGDIVKWLAPFSISYSTEPEVVVRHAIFNGTLPEGCHMKLMRRDSINRHTLTWDQYDYAGKVLADPSDPSIKHKSIWREIKDFQMYWAGPFDSSGGF